MNKSKKASSEFVVTGSNSSITFEFLKETFNKMSLLILLFVKRNIILTVTPRFNASCVAFSTDLFSEPKQIISGINHDHCRL